MKKFKADKFTSKSASKKKPFTALFTYFGVGISVSTFDFVLCRALPYLLFYRIIISFNFLPVFPFITPAHHGRQILAPNHSRAAFGYTVKIAHESNYAPISSGSRFCPMVDTIGQN